jgi:hypothetical protein
MWTLRLVCRLEDADADEREEEPRSTSVLYSLPTHQVMKMVSMSGLSSTLVPNELFIIIVRSSFVYHSY